MPPETASLGIVTNVLEAVARDPQSRDRIAFASTFSHGENAWVTEVAWHGAQHGIRVDREIGRVDLTLGETSIEFKSSMSAWAILRTDEQRREWWGKDVTTLRQGKAPGVLVITIATPREDVTHRRFQRDFDRATAREGLSRDQIHKLGIEAAERFMWETGFPEVVPVNLGSGRDPVSGGDVLLTAVTGTATTDND